MARISSCGSIFWWGGSGLATVTGNPSSSPLMTANTITTPENLSNHHHHEDVDDVKKDITINGEIKEEEEVDSTPTKSSIIKAKKHHDLFLLLSSLKQFLGKSFSSDGFHSLLKYLSIHSLIRKFYLLLSLLQRKLSGALRKLTSSKWTWWCLRILSLHSITGPSSNSTQSKPNPLPPKPQPSSSASSSPCLSSSSSPCKLYVPSSNTAKSSSTTNSNATNSSSSSVITKILPMIDIPTISTLSADLSYESKDISKGEDPVLISISSSLLLWNPSPDPQNPTLAWRTGGVSLLLSILRQCRRRKGLTSVKIVSIVKSEKEESSIRNLITFNHTILTFLNSHNTSSLFSHYPPPPSVASKKMLEDILIFCKSTEEMVFLITETLKSVMHFESSGSRVNALLGKSFHLGEVEGTSPKIIWINPTNPSHASIPSHHDLAVEVKQEKRTALGVLLSSKASFVNLSACSTSSLPSRSISPPTMVTPPLSLRTSTPPPPLPTLQTKKSRKEEEGDASHPYNSPPPTTSPGSPPSSPFFGTPSHNGISLSLSLKGVSPTSSSSFGHLNLIEEVEGRVVRIGGLEEVDETCLVDIFKSIIV